MLASFQQQWTSNMDFYFLELSQCLHGYSIAELDSPVELFFVTSKIVIFSWLKAAGSFAFTSYKLWTIHYSIPITSVYQNVSIILAVNFLCTDCPWCKNCKGVSHYHMVIIAHACSELSKEAPVLQCSANSNADKVKWGGERLRRRIQKIIRKKVVMQKPGYFDCWISGNQTGFN